MNIKGISYFVSLMLVLLLTNNTAYGQLPAPHMYLVTVNPETGYDSIIWQSIPLSPNTDYYSVAIRLVPAPGMGDSYMPITTAILDTFYVNTNSESASHSVGYTVWGAHPNGVNIDTGAF